MVDPQPQRDLLAHHDNGRLKDDDNSKDLATPPQQLPLCQQTQEEEEEDDKHKVDLLPASSLLLPAPSAPPTHTYGDSAHPAVAERLQRSVHGLTSIVDQLQCEVLRVTRMRSLLKRERSQEHRPLKVHESENSGNKKLRLYDEARTEAIKRKKRSNIFRLCGTLLRQLMQHKWAWPFLQPVDVECLELKDYHKIIKKPMDLGTIKKRLEKKDSTGYRYVQEFCEDVRLVFRNAMLYNDSSSDVYNMANTLSQRFEKKWKLNVEPRLLEEEEKYDQQDKLCSKITELHAQEEQAAIQLGDDVITQLTDVEKMVNSLLVQILSKCSPMKNEERRELHQRMCKLPSSSLRRVMEILSLGNAYDSTTDDIHINLDALNSNTLWRLHFFVKMITEFAQQKAVDDNEAHASR